MSKRREYYSVGLDFGTNSVRAVVVSVGDGSTVGTGVFKYRHGEMGVVTDPADPNLARQHPVDYLEGIEHTVTAALSEAGPEVADAVVGIGVDTTGSTPIPVDASGEALALRDDFKDHPAAMAWLWKDHTAYREAAEITEAAESAHPEYLAKCGGVYSSEWFWAKLLKCARTDSAVFSAAASWVELADWVPAILTGTTSLDQVKRCICAAGHKAMYNPVWGGYPDADFVGSFDDGVLSAVRATLPAQAVNISDTVGGLTAEWASKLGLPKGIPVAGGGFDAHLGGVGSGIKPGTMVKVIGTSTCDLAVLPFDHDLSDIPGVCGVVPESILPGNYGIEAGQSAVGDIFNWYVHKLQAGNGMDHEQLGRDSELLYPGESGLLALDWNNGNRTVLVDQQLSGMVLGLTLHSSPAEIFRALVEATAFGARMIRDRMVEYGVPIERVITCGGISVKSPMLMQIYADVFNCPMLVSASDQTCALGSAIAGAVVAGVYEDFGQAADAMTSIREKQYTPIPENVAVYEQLFALYRRLHDLFGTKEYAENQFSVMKELISIREAQRARRPVERAVTRTRVNGKPLDCQELRERVCEANREIARVELAILTWGNASEVDREAGVFAIKPSGVAYDALTPSDIVVISMETGDVVSGELSPSSDMETHWHLYRCFERVGGIVHTHSTWATAWAQAKRPVPCLGTTHADAFHGSIPCTQPLTKDEVESRYELNTGKVIAKHFAEHSLSPTKLPGVLVSCHGPFSWGTDALKAVTNAQILEETARIAAATEGINPAAVAVEQYLLDKHYLRKHGSDAYYGQEKKT